MSWIDGQSNCPAGHWTPVFAFLGRRVMGFRVKRLGVWGLGFRVWGLGVWGLGFRAEGL